MSDKAVFFGYLMIIEGKLSCIMRKTGFRVSDQV